jgi:spermidine/putrescine transport system permease protein
MRLMNRIFTEELPFLFVCPALLWQFVFLYTPFAILVAHSIIDYIPAKKAYVFTFAYYHQIFNSLYFKSIVRAFSLASTTAIICFCIAYPVAYYLSMRGTKRYKTLLLFSLILPSWTSLIVQVYAWFFLLEKNGFVSRALQFLGIISPKFHLLNNYFSIVLGMVSCYLPFMILPIYAVLEKMDKRYLEASADLGADRFETFKRVIFPLSLPGVSVGMLLVFIPSFGEFAIPALLGGSKYVVWGNIIVDKFLRSRDWRVGAALVMVGVMVPIFIMLIGYVMVRIKSIIKERKNSASSVMNSSKEFWS